MQNYERIWTKIICLLAVIQYPDLDQEDKDEVVQQPQYLYTNKDKEIRRFLWVFCAHY